MLKKRITYVDYDGNERSEDFYFNLTKSELLEMDLMEEGGMKKTIEKIVDEKDNKKIMTYFKDIIWKSYGQKSADGKRFIKNDAFTKAFTETEAYSQLYIELASDAEASAAFINGVLPNQPQDHLEKTS